MAARLLLALALVASIWPFVGGGGDAHACIPVPALDIPAAQQVESSERIFIGEHLGTSANDENLHFIRVERYLKGEGGAFLVVQDDVCAKFLGRELSGRYPIADAGTALRLDGVTRDAADQRIAEIEALVPAQSGEPATLADDPLPPWATAAAVGAALALGAGLLVGVADCGAADDYPIGSPVARSRFGG